MNKPALSVFAAAVLGACAANSQTPSVGMANPASEFCVKQGGKTEIRKNADGSEYGVCILPNGQEVEEWAYFRQNNPSNERIDVYKSDESSQCNGGGISPEAMQSQLKNIRVYQLRKGNLNRIYPAVCGGKTGNINIFTIDKKDVAAAQKLGFEVLSE